jgi:hypothetical protein
MFREPTSTSVERRSGNRAFWGTNHDRATITFLLRLIQSTVRAERFVWRYAPQ